MDGVEPTDNVAEYALWLTAQSGYLSAFQAQSDLSLSRWPRLCSTSAALKGAPRRALCGPVLQGGGDSPSNDGTIQPWAAALGSRYKCGLSLGRAQDLLSAMCLTAARNNGLNCSRSTLGSSISYITCLYLSLYACSTRITACCDAICFGTTNTNPKHLRLLIVATATTIRWPSLNGTCPLASSYREPRGSQSHASTHQPGCIGVRVHRLTSQYYPSPDDKAWSTQLL
jgi:hypothetical protein